MRIRDAYNAELVRIELKRVKKSLDECSMMITENLASCKKVKATDG